MDKLNLQKLKEPFNPSLISWRVGATTKDKTKAIPLAYIDARDVMERLDEVCGIDGWQCRYSHANGKTIAEIGIKINDEWIWKANGAGDTAIEADKGAISDAMKRAAVLWGVGRYLYDVPNMWVEIDNFKKIKNPNDPRLTKALEQAAKGIRGGHEPEPQQEEIRPIKKQPLDGALYAQIVKDIKQSKTHGELNSARQAATKARQAYVVNKEQALAIKKTIDKKFEELTPQSITVHDMNQPIQMAAE